MMVATVLLVFLVQMLVPAWVAFIILRQTSGFHPDRAVACGLTASPVVVCVVAAILWRFGCTLHPGRFAVLVLFGVAAGAARWRAHSREFLSSHALHLWLATVALWLAQKALIFCHGPFWQLDWAFHWQLIGQTYEHMTRGLWPVNPLRTVLFTAWLAPTLLLTGGPSAATFWVFQLAGAVVGSLACPVAYLWAERLAGQREGWIAWYLTLLCSGLTYWTLYTWPVPLASILVAFSYYVFACASDASRGHRQIGWVIAGLMLTAAYQVHFVAAPYFVLLAACALIRPLPWPFVVACLVTVGAGQVAVMAVFPNWVQMLDNTLSWSPLHSLVGIGPPQTVGQLLVGLWHTLGFNVQTTFIHLTNAEPFAYPVNLLDDVTSALFPTFPLLGCLGLFLARIRRWSDGLTMLALAAAVVVTLLLAVPTHPLAHALMPAVLVLLALSATGVTRLPAVVARTAWILTLVQYVAFRTLTLVWETWPAALDAKDLNEKTGHGFILLGAQFLADDRRWVTVTALAGLVLSAAWLSALAWKGEIDVV